MKKYRIVLAWGWTGWHVFPIQSMLIHLDKHYADRIDKIYRYGSRKWLEYSVFQKTNLSHIKATFVHSIAWKFRRETRILSWLKNITDMFVFIIGILSALRFLRRSHPDVIFCKGWFVALPLIIAAAIKRIPIIVHESDTSSWLTNRIASWIAKTTYTAFPWVYKKEECVGQILSDAIIPVKDYRTSNDILQSLIDTHNPKKTYIVIIWWSQWSQFLYKSIAEIAGYNKKVIDSYEILIVGGFHKDNQEYDFSAHANMHWLWFCSQEDMAAILSIADMSITRAGTTSLAEQQLFNIKKIIVPISRTHDQYNNAQRYHKHHHDIVIDAKEKGYLETLDLTLQQHIGYKKKSYDMKAFTSITTIKDTIANSFFS